MINENTQIKEDFLTLEGVYLVKTHALSEEPFEAYVHKFEGELCCFSCDVESRGRG